eukprot:6174674-Pleurochrysis_carterae.AAC.6
MAARLRANRKTSACLTLLLLKSSTEFTCVFSIDFLASAVDTFVVVSSATSGAEISLFTGEFLWASAVPLTISFAAEPISIGSS